MPWGFWQNWDVMLYSLPGILIGLTLHEFAHAYAAHKLGDPTPQMTGRLTLNPLKHIDWFGFIMLIVVGFGYAKPVMINPTYFKNRRSGEVLVSLAGVFTNLVTAFIFSLVLYLIAAFATNPNVILFNIVLYIVVINLALMLFNLIPIPPLDGWHVIKPFIRVRNVRAMWNFERFGFIILIVLLLTPFVRTYLSTALNYIITAFVQFWALIFGVPFPSFMGL